jgi:membrane protein
MRERLALVVMTHVAARFAEGHPPWTLQLLAQQLGIPMHPVKAVLDALEEKGLLVKSHDEPPAYLPARDLAEVSLAELVAAIRSAGETPFLNCESLDLAPQARDLVEQMERAIAASLASVSVKALAEGAHAAPRSRSPIAVAPDDRAPHLGSTRKPADPAGGAP